MARHLPFRALGGNQSVSVFDALYIGTRRGKMDTFQSSQTHRAAQDREEIPMSESRKYLGLCSTCKHSSICTYPRDPNRPVSYCCENEGYEECEGSVSLGLLTSGNIFRRPFDSVDTSLNVERDSRIDQGLCKNCANHENCTFPRPEGGVWHCDEYQ